MKAIIWFVVVLLACVLLAVITGCMAKGYRHCVYYGPAGYCIDKPHTHVGTNIVLKRP